MDKEAIIPVLVFIAGVVFILLVVVDAYFKFKKANTYGLKIAKQSPLWKKIMQVLETHFAYYQDLPSTELKDDFVFRTYNFMRRRRWISSSKPILTIHQKTLISASAIQLTFGLKNFSFYRFKTILVHEDAYYNRITKQYHRGEVNQAGLIVLSWKHFEQGYEDANDKINLGLHEMAHALDLVIHLTQGRAYNLHRLMSKFQQSAFDEMAKMRTENDRFLRSYGAVNGREFFSVAVEHFFEAPHDFREKLPDLYMELCQVLNQDPCNRVFRGYKSPHSTQYKNSAPSLNQNFNKPLIQLKPNGYIFIPLLAYTGLLALAYPFSKYILHTWSLGSAIALLTVYLLTLFILVKYKAAKFKIVGNHILIRNSIYGKIKSTIHLKNIISVDFVYLLTRYQTKFVYFEGEIIKEIHSQFYFSPNSIKKLERILLQQNIKIKHNNKWLKKENY